MPNKTALLNSWKYALNNICTHGDTDIFPFSIENHIFKDKQDESIKLLGDIHDHFEDYLAKYPPQNESTLSAVGYTGFRWATQLDPIWNAYLLGLVISVGELIEHDRIELPRKRVFSYRFHYDPSTHDVFRKDTGWVEFQERSRELAQNYKYILICDIADFYSRIYHHRLDNALRTSGVPGDIYNKIMSLLMNISHNRSYGLPVGGPCARLLSELLLARTDRLLTNYDIEFCRFADDYHIFAQDSQTAYKHLVYISELLYQNEGLSLQKMKTRILTSSEFLAFPSSKPGELIDNEATNFISSIRLRFDPYSPNAHEDYEKLSQEVRKFDIIGMLTREMAKSRIHEAITRKLIKAVKFLNPEIRANTVRSLIDNIHVLAPVFPTVMILLRDLLPELPGDVQDYICAKLRLLFATDSHLLTLHLNVCYALRVLALRHSYESEALLAQLYRRTTDRMVRRDVILIMANWNCVHWISDIKNRFASLDAWERRAFIIANYILQDEGKHWREAMKDSFTPIEKLFLSWASQRASGSKKGIPL